MGKDSHIILMENNQINVSLYCVKNKVLVDWYFMVG